jgi:rubrerythrin
MFTPKQYREKAAEYSEFAKQANAPNEVREFQKRERNFTRLADNEQWLADNHDKLVNNLDKLVPLGQPQQ